MKAMIPFCCPRHFARSRSMVPKNSPRTNLAHLVCSISGDTSHRCPQHAFSHSRAPRQYNHWDAKFHCISTLTIEARQRCIFHLVPAKMRETIMIDWHGSIGRHGPSGAFPGHLHEDLADSGILNRNHHTPTPQRRHSPSCGIIVRYRPVLWSGSMPCCVVRTRQDACYSPSHNHRG